MHLWLFRSDHPPTDETKRKTRYEKSFASLSRFTSRSTDYRSLAACDYYLCLGSSRRFDDRWRKTVIFHEGSQQRASRTFVQATAGQEIAAKRLSFAVWDRRWPWKRVPVRTKSGRIAASSSAQWTVTTQHEKRNNARPPFSPSLSYATIRSSYLSRPEKRCWYVTERLRAFLRR